MIVTYLRSSSYNDHSTCPQLYYLSYVLGEKPPSSKPMDLGTIVHKALETLAWVKLTRQQGMHSFEDDAFGHVEIAEVTPEWATRRAFEYYVPLSPQHEWDEADLATCIKWTNKALAINRGMFDPRNRNIIAPEQRFDIAIDRPWAHYRYDYKGDTIDGQLSLKGTIDLIVEDDPGLVEVIDWKTGQSRKDWTKVYPTEKTYADLRHDPQLCLYHLAAASLYPEAEEIFLTIVYINAGGPFTLCFDRSDLVETEELVRKKFEDIRDTQTPKLVRSWKCGKRCYFGTHTSPHDPSKTICQFFADEVRRKGADRVTEEYGRDKAFEAYGSGGGKRDSI